MSRKVRARAHANIALCKYWGKSGPLDTPATPSISLALDSLTTITTAEMIDAADDAVVINGKVATGIERERVVRYLDIWRTEKLIEGRVRIESENSFPMSSGLASSSSAFAALATALNELSEVRITQTLLTKLARRGSGSAARSITGGLSSLSNGDDPAARLLVPASDVPWGMVVGVVDSEPKQYSSREGMKLSEQTSPYYRRWVLQARHDYRYMLHALRGWDLAEVGEIAEENSNAMHACMLATRPTLMYWQAGTMDIMHSVVAWRNEGLKAYYTVDAGSHVAVLCHIDDLDEVTKRMQAVPSVVKAIANRPGGAAVLVAMQ
ncbi:MAG: diphosphomevalonate decarboxylase [Planctomycetales bacterium]|nr:diphosphomevalonate decarboxylase [bacterium]UNM08970.1 MAG: diphosphomevalonate decarboxylase [Planctomycetales bacterium]